LATLKWLTPDVIPTDSVQRQLCIPNDPAILAAVTGALLPLIYPENWELYGDITPDEISLAMATMFSDFVAVTRQCVLAVPILISDEKTQNTNGGTATVGSWQKRALNTVVDPESILISLTSDEFTLPPGLWLIEWSAPAYIVNGHQSRLYSVSEAGVVKYGSSEKSGAAGVSVTRSQGRAIQNNAVNTTYRIEHRVASTVTNQGYGIPFNQGTEVYTQVKCSKLD